jgi:hypothetical protein
MSHTSHKIPFRPALDFPALAILILLLLELGLRSLNDVDLGWHLAGGLWILETRAAPGSDPLAAPGTLWVCYSWLPEIVYAWLFKLGGFSALLWSQALLIVFSGVALVVALRSLGPAADTELRRRVIEAVAFLLIIFLVAPMWHLRPQLLSFALFLFTLLLAEQKKLNWWIASLIAILWVNIHVYWVFVPFLAGLYRVLPAFINLDRKEFYGGMGAVTASFFAGAVSPYGFLNHASLFEYVFNHSAANSLITEFQPLGPDLELPFWSVCLILVIVAVWGKSYFKFERLPGALLFIGTAILTFKSRKYLPLFACAAILPLIQYALPAVIRSPKGEFDILKLKKYERPLVIGSIAVVALYLLMVPVPPALEPKYSTLLDTAKRAIQGVDPGKRLVVLNHFDQGGWLELAFTLYGPRDAEGNVVRAAVDGRTLVMGARRLMQFQDLRVVAEGSCDVIRSWNPGLAILPNNKKITKAMREGDPNLPCAKDWQIWFEVADWTVFKPSTQPAL